VALIEDPSDTSILPRLRAELAGLGLDVRLVAKKPGEQLPRDLIDAARNTDAVAAFRIVVDEAHADVWIADRVTGKVVLREMLPRGAQMDGRVVALRAVELLRVSLLELDARRPPVDEPPAPVTLPASSALLEDLERASLTAATSLLWSPGGTSPAIGVAAAAAWRPSWVGVRLFGGSMLAPATLSRPEGDGDLTTSWLGMDAIAQPRRARMIWRPRVGFGFAALSTEVRGNANPSWISKQKRVYTWSPVASAELGWAVHTRVRVSLGICYFRPVRSVDLLVAGNTVADYGRNILIANLGLDLVLP
jgi:hypothetical protein